VSFDVTLPPFDWSALDRYLAGDSSPEEADAVRRWLADDPTRQGAVDALVSLGLPDQIAKRDWKTAATWAALSTKLRRVDRVGGIKRVLARGDVRDTGIPVFGWDRGYGRGAGVGLLIATMAASLVLLLRSTRASEALRGSHVEALNYVTARGERATVTLHDGTRVVLGPASRLRVENDPGHYTTTARLDGEGVFSVRHDAARTFVVQTARAETRDLGTTFGVRDYASDPGAQVVVREGSVAVAATVGEHASGATLRANDIAMVDSDGQIRSRHGSVASLLEWGDGTLMFDAAPLTDVVQDMGRWFDLDIRIGTATLGDRRVTASFTTESADDAVRIVADALGLTVVHDGRVVTLTTVQPKR
jgi:transmembrane sensor